MIWSTPVLSPSLHLLREKYKIWSVNNLVTKAVRCARCGRIFYVCVDEKKRRVRKPHKRSRARHVRTGATHSSICTNCFWRV